MLMFRSTHRALMKIMAADYESRIGILTAENDRMRRAMAGLPPRADNGRPRSMLEHALSTPPIRTRDAAPAAPARRQRDVPPVAADTPAPTIIVVQGAGDASRGAGGRDSPADPAPAPDAPADKGAEKSHGGAPEFETGGGFGGESFSSGGGSAGSDGGGGGGGSDSGGGGSE